MPGEADEIVTFRLPSRDRAAIQRLVDAGAFQNRSDFLRTAIRNALREHGAHAPRLDLTLEGVDLPDAGPARARGRSTITKRGHHR
jgi:Arc/MetJ-type ribon-helix-helix transcriptional regulator